MTDRTWQQPAPRVRPPRLPAARRRDQLCEVALDLFAVRGYHDTSMDDIAEAAGVTKPVLYQHFSSKRVLYLELLRGVGDELRAAVNAAAGRPTPFEQVLAGFRSYFRFVARRPRAFRLLFGSGARELDEATQAVADVEDDLALLIGGFIDADLSDEHRATLGYAVVGLAEVTGRQWADRARSRTTPDANGHGTRGDVPRRLDDVEADRLARWLADLVWAGLRSLPPR